MAYTTVFDDVVFIEGKHQSATVIKHVKIDLGHKFGAQLKNLTDVKRALANQVKTSGGNCLIDFQYGQKSRWLALDDVSFWGSGSAASLPQQIYDEISAKAR